MYRFRVFRYVYVFQELQRKFSFEKYDFNRTIISCTLNDFYSGGRHVCPRTLRYFRVTIMLYYYGVYDSLAVLRTRNPSRRHSVLSLLDSAGQRVYNTYYRLHPVDTRTERRTRFIPLCRMLLSRRKRVSS